MQRLWIPGPLPGMNEIIDARMRSSWQPNQRGRRWNAYSDMKKMWGERIGLLAQSQRFRPIENGFFTYLCYEKDRHRDPSNLVAGAVKLIEDALKDTQLLPNDGWAQVLGYVGHWHVQPSMPGVTLFVHEEMLLTKETALLLDEEARKEGQKWAKHEKTCRLPSASSPP